jgi:hypothetical protein
VDGDVQRLIDAPPSASTTVVGENRCTQRSSGRRKNSGRRKRRSVRGPKVIDVDEDKGGIPSLARSDRVEVTRNIKYCISVCVRSNNVLLF